MTTIDLSAPTRNIVMDQGSTIEIPFTFKRSGVAVNMTGYILRAQFRKSYSATDTIINATLANGILAFVDATAGTFKLRFEETDTSYAGNPKVMFSKDSPDEMELVYDLEAVAVDGTVYKVCKGTLTIYREGTR